MSNILKMSQELSTLKQNKKPYQTPFEASTSKIYLFFTKINKNQQKRLDF